MQKLTNEVIRGLCRSIFPNLTWKQVSSYQEGKQHGKQYGTLNDCNQFLDVTILVGNNAIAIVYLGKPHEATQVAILRGDMFALSSSNPAQDLSRGLEKFQNQMIVRAKLGVIFASQEKLSDPNNLDLTDLTKDNFNQPRREE